MIVQIIKNEEIMYKLTFLPFIGKSYNNNNAFGNKRIMVLGESHYASVTSPDITRDVLARYLDPSIEREGWMNTFLKFERSLVNKETTREDSRHTHCLGTSSMVQSSIHKLGRGGRNPCRWLCR